MRVKQSCRLRIKEKKMKFKKKKQDPMKHKLNQQNLTERLKVKVEKMNAITIIIRKVVRRITSHRTTKKIVTRKNVRNLEKMKRRKAKRIESLVRTKKKTKKIQVKPAHPRRHQKPQKQQKTSRRLKQLLMKNPSIVKKKSINHLRSMTDITRQRLKKKGLSHSSQVEKSKALDVPTQFLISIRMLT